MLHKTCPALQPPLAITIRNETAKGGEAIQGGLRLIQSQPLSTLSYHLDTLASTTLMSLASSTDFPSYIQPYLGAPLSLLPLNFAFILFSPIFHFPIHPLVRSTQEVTGRHHNLHSDPPNVLYDSIHPSHSGHYYQNISSLIHSTAFAQPISHPTA